MSEPLSISKSAEKLNHLNRLRSKFASRDGNMAVIKAVRQGNITQLFPAELQWDEQFQGAPVSNFIDIVARDLSEGIAPLPQLACTSGSMKHDTDRKRAERKNQMGLNYWLLSKLQKYMYGGADQFASTGFCALYVEPDVDAKMPRICVEDSIGTYYELDRVGNTVTYAHIEHMSVDDLVAAYGEYVPGSVIKGESDNGAELLEVVKWIDKDAVTLFLPQREGLVLLSYRHKLSRHPVRIVERPGFSKKTPRGQFDDVVWVQVARTVMGLLALKAADRAVNAPLAVPNDVDEVPTGPDAVISSDNAKDIQVLNLQVPQSIFAENAVLDQELRLGSRYPDARTGELQASVITGKGVEALLGTFDSQVRGDQQMFQEGLEYVTSICFEMDEVWWPNETKTVRGNTTAGSFEFTYTPAQDIAGRYECTVTYGFATGMKPSQAIVSMLQLAGAGFIAKKTAMGNLGGIFDIDPDQEERSINTESAREALKQGLFAYIQSSGQVAAQGGDPLSVIKLGVDTIKNMEDGQAVEIAIENAYQTLQQAQQQAAEEAQQAQQAQAAASGGSPAGPGGPQEGLQPPEHVAPGQAGLPPGGLPTVQNLVAGFRGNGSLPVNQATVQRRVATGT